MNSTFLSFFLYLLPSHSFFHLTAYIVTQMYVLEVWSRMYNQTEYKANRVESLLGYNKGYFLVIYCSIFQNIFNYYITQFPLGEFRWCDFYLYSVDA